jgi:AcrR family transcriptional regulator
MQRVAKIERVVDLREAGKSRRRRQILDAARKLIETDGREALSMRRLAECAQLSTRTLYNLYGAKEDILYALLDDNSREIEAGIAKLSLACPLDRSRALINVHVDVADSRPAINRALIRGIEVGAVGRSRDNEQMSRTRSRHEAVIAEAMEKGMLLRITSPRALAHHIVLAFGQACRLWSREAISTAEFRAQTQHTRVLYLLSVAAPHIRPRLERELDALGPEVQALVQRLDALAQPSPALLAARERRRATAV